MQDNNTANSLDAYQSEMTLNKLFKILLQGKWVIISITSIVSISTVLFSLYLPNIYKSEALLAPVEPSDGISGALSNYSGLATLAGISIPSQSEENNAIKAIEKIHSLSFFENNILPNIALEELMAINYWNSKTKKIVFDDDIYDELSKKWVRDFSYPQKLVPSAQESYEIFLEEHLNVSEDKKTGFISLSIKHESPYVAKEWTDLIISQINDFYRKQDKIKSTRSIEYLNTQLLETNFAEIKAVIAELLQQEIQKLALIESNEFYVFDFIDPPAVMEKKSEPTRSLISILGALFGGLLSVIVVLIQYFRINVIEA